MDSISDDLLKLQARFDQWRANRKYKREPIPDQLRDAALEMSRRYAPSLLQRVLKIQLCRLMPKGYKKSAGDASAAFLGPPVDRLPTAIKLKMAAVQTGSFKPLPSTLTARFRAG